jgi:hypothetical protein
MEPPHGLISTRPAILPGHGGSNLWMWDTSFDGDINWFVQARRVAICWSNTMFAVWPEFVGH